MRIPGQVANRESLRRQRLQFYSQNESQVPQLSEERDSNENNITEQSLRKPLNITILSHIY